MKTTVHVIILTAFFSQSLAWRSLKPLYGRPCVNGTAEKEYIVCEEAAQNTNLYCSERKICECIPSTKYSQVVYDTELQSCLPVPGPEDDFRCQSDFQCQQSSYGRLSMCDKDVGSCACFSEIGEVELKNNICFAKISPRNKIQYDKMPTCIDENSICQQSSLGNLTRCNQAEQLCECYDTATRGKNEVGLWEGRCYYKRKIGEFCLVDEECRVGHHKNAICSQGPSYLGPEKECMCPEGLTCDGDSGSNRETAAKSVSLVLLATFVCTFLKVNIVP